MNRKLIYIIDNDEMSRYITAKMVRLKEPSCVIREFDNVVSAIGQITSNIHDPQALPDIIFLDLYLPDKNGAYFLQEYQKISDQLPKDIHIHVLTAEAVEKKKPLHSAFIQSFIEKPITQEMLMQVL